MQQPAAWKRRHTVSRSLITKIKTPLENSKGVNLRGTTLFRRKACLITRFDGRTRSCLPIDSPAPRPCSVPFPAPPHTCRGSLTGCRNLLFSSPLFMDCKNHYSLIYHILSTIKLSSGVIRRRCTMPVHTTPASICRSLRHVEAGGTGRPSAWQDTPVLSG